MTDYPFPDWATSAADAQFAASEDVRSKQTLLEKKVRRRNFTEYAAGALIIPIFAWVTWLTFDAGEYLVSASWLSMIVGVTVVLLNLRRVGPLLPHNPEENCRSHLRTQLAHQHSALSSVGRWYIGPFIPGMVFVIVAMAEFTARTTGWLIALSGMIIPVLIVCAVFAVVIWLNTRTARELARKIDELDHLDRDDPA